MELAFLTGAIRRYFWIIVLGAVLGAIPGLLARGTAEQLYESRAVLLIAPPSDSTSLVTFSGDPDRYVAGELSVLESLADRVAEEIEGADAAELGAKVTFEQQPLTDVVVIVATDPDPAAAQEIAATYAAVYFDVLRSQLAGTQDPALSAIDEDIAEVQAQLDDVDSRLSAALAPYVNREAVPTAEQVAPALASEKSILITRYNELQATRSDMSTGLQVSSRVVREATLPTDPLPSSSRTLLMIGVVAGAFLGLLAAVVVARLSSTIIDDEQTAEILGHPVVGTMPPRPELVGDRLTLLDEPHGDAAQFLDLLGVRVEAASDGIGTLTVVVCGTGSGAGTTSLAASLARQIASNGPQVLLVDADRHHPELSSLLLDGTHKPGDDGVAPTDMPNLTTSTLALLAGRGSTSTRGSRLDAAEAIGNGTAHADVLVFDGGPLMDSASTVQLSRICDVVVLAMPPRQQVRPLETIAGELRSRDQLLPVRSQLRSRRRRARRDRTSDVVPSDVRNGPTSSRPMPPVPPAPAPSPLPIWSGRRDVDQEEHAK